MGLFRQQALDQQSRLHGEVFLVPPLRWQAMGWLLLFAMAVAMLLLTVSSYSQTVAVDGLLHSPDHSAQRAHQNSAADTADALLSPAGIGWTAELLVPTARIASIMPGQQVSLAMTGYPAQNFGALTGRVTQVSQTFTDATGSHVPVMVQLDPLTERQVQSRMTLRENAPLDGRIVIARRSLLQWLFAPLMAGAA